MQPVKGTLTLLLALALAGCIPELSRGRRDYHDGMRRLRYDPDGAREDFEEAAGALARALTEEELEPRERITAVSIRARCLIELGRHEEAGALLSPPPPDFAPDRVYEGDLAGLALLRAFALDPERGYAELLRAERAAQTLPARLHIAWQQVHLLQKINTPQSRAEAIKICNSHAGKLDFDAIKKSLGKE